MILQVRFQPQAWKNDYAIDVDAEGERGFTVEWPESKPIPKSHSDASDALKAQGPQWVRDWTGPFYIEILNRADIEVQNHGTIFLVRPLNETAREWLNEHVQSEGWQWLGGALAVEHRCIDDLVEGMKGDGLEVR